MGGEKTTAILSDGFFIFDLRGSVINQVSYFFQTKIFSVMFKNKLIFALFNTGDESRIGIGRSVPRVLQELPDPSGAHVITVRFQRLEMIEDVLRRVGFKYLGDDSRKFIRGLIHLIHPSIMEQNGVLKSYLTTQTLSQQPASVLTTSSTSAATTYMAITDSTALLMVIQTDIWSRSEMPWFRYTFSEISGSREKMSLFDQAHPAFRFPIRISTNCRNFHFMEFIEQFWIIALPFTSVLKIGVFSRQSFHRQA